VIGAEAFNQKLTRQDGAGRKAAMTKAPQSGPGERLLVAPARFSE
jgi:hypothetical protein